MPLGKSGALGGRATVCERPLFSSGTWEGELAMPLGKMGALAIGCELPSPIILTSSLPPV